MPAEGASPPQHFDKLGEPPSMFTLELRNGLKAKLPFDDMRDYDEAKRGFIAEPPYTKIMADAGARRLGHGELRLASPRQGLREHQSLAAAAGGAQHAYGLYEVVPDRIYQVRGYDLSKHQLHQGQYRLDHLRPPDCQGDGAGGARVRQRQAWRRPVVGVVYSHSHVDHFGGVRGVVDEADVASDKVTVIAPAGFLDAAIAENAFAGNAMSRRTQWQYAVLLQRNPFGHVDQASGKNVARTRTSSSAMAPRARTCATASCKPPSSCATACLTGPPPGRPVPM
jgi:alkyl sulfatase BDS1-like metallo-beta-lactamase superfamily hydrolase